MLQKRKSFNPKRSIQSGATAEELQRLGGQVRYGGNPEHKRNPGDFGLNPPSCPRKDKTLCDGVNIFRRDLALRLLRAGIERGLFSTQSHNGFPQNVWAVTEDGCPLEAQLENAGDGTYHGYPMPEADAFREIVLERWRGA